MQPKDFVMEGVRIAENGLLNVGQRSHPFMLGFSGRTSIEDLAHLLQRMVYEAGSRS